MSAERFADYLLGVLPPAEAAAVERELRDDPAMAAELDALREVLHGLAYVPRPVAPAPSLRARVLAAAEGKGRLARFVEHLARFVDVSAEKARALLDAVDESAAWEAGPAPGVALLHFNGGPRFATADCGLVRFPAGMDWPLHRHLGDEGMFIFQGGIVDDSGVRHVAGDELHMKPGSEHSFKVLPEEDCVCAVIIHVGIEMPPGHRLTI